MNDIKLTLSDLSIDDVNILLAALQEVPAKLCNPLSEKIRNQAQAQLPQQEAAPAPVAE